MDPLTDSESVPAQETTGPALLVPGGQRVGGGSRRARAVFSVGMVLLVVLASLAAWQGFLHSPWGKRLGALNEIVFAGGSNSVSASVPLAPQLYVLHPDGSGLRRLTSEDDSSYFSPVWSPDGARIAAFVTSSQHPLAHLVIMDADGSHARVISAVALDLDVFNLGSGVATTEASKLIAWSPDGSQLVALAGIRQYMLVQADGSRTRLVRATRPTWSPDGRYLAYYVEAPGNQDGSGSDGATYIVQLLDTQTLKTRLLSGLAALNAEVLAWSPDGRYLAASAFSEGSFRSLPIDSITLLDPTTGKPTPMARWLNAQIQEIAWSPDSTRLAVVVQSFDDSNGSGSGGFNLIVVNLDGSFGPQIGPSDNGQPSWSPDGKQLVYDSPTDPVLLVADATQSRPTPRTLSSPVLDYLFGPCWSPLAGLL